MIGASILLSIAIFSSPAHDSGIAQVTDYATEAEKDGRECSENDLMVCNSLDYDQSDLSDNQAEDDASETFGYRVEMRCSAASETVPMCAWVRK